MALVLKDRVQETATPNTTVSFSCNGPVTGFQAFSTIGNGNTTYYTAVDSSGNWESGLGTYTTAGDLVTRTTISASSNAGSAVTFSGAVSLFISYPATKSVNLDASGNVSALGTVASGTWQGSTVGVAYGGTGVTASTGANSVVLRDANENIIVNSVTQELTSTISSAAITTLTPASSHFQVLTGTTTQTYKLPDATSLPTGSTWIFDNDSTGNLTITDNAGATVDVVAAGGYSTVFLEANGTVGGEWGRFGMIPAEVNWGTNSLNLGGLTVITNGTWNGATIAYNYGGTGLTSFAAANNALYSTSASALTAGTLPVLAGGTGVTTSTGTGNNVLSAAPTFTGTVNTANLAYTGTLTGGTGVIAIGTNQIYKDASGNVGIGTSSITQLYSAITTAVAGNLRLGSASAIGFISFGDQTSATSNVGIWRGAGGNSITAGNFLQLGGYDGITFTTGNASLVSQTERMRITSAGGISFGSSGTAYGTSGQVLSSAGNAAPTWINQSSITSGACSGNAATATTATNQSGGTVSATTGAFSGAVAMSNNIQFTANSTYGINFNGASTDMHRIYLDAYWTIFKSHANEGWKFRDNSNIDRVTITGAAGNLTSTGYIAGTNITSGGNVTGSSASCTGNAATATTLIGDSSNWASYRSTAVANMLSWKNYGNNHVIFDASQSTAPNGAAINNTTPSNAWTGSYPTLMGWNGGSTFGVRTYISNISETCTGNAATASNVLGNGQTWQNVLASRAKNTTYTNSTGRSIMVNIVAYQTGSAPTAVCQGVAVALINGSGSQINASFICPNGATYLYSGTGGTITYWAELR